MHAQKNMFLRDIDIFGTHVNTRKRMRGLRQSRTEFRSAVVVLALRDYQRI